MKELKKKVVGYTIITSIVGQAMSLAAFGVWAGALALATPFERALAATEETLFEQTQRKYQTNDPNNNRSDDAKLNKILADYANQPSLNPNKESEIINKYYANPQPTGTVDLSRYGDYSANAQERIEASISEARSISMNATIPSTDSAGAIQADYNPSGVELTKENGNFSATFDENGIVGQKVSKDEYTSAEITHNQTNFTADEDYGDETAFYASGSSQITSLKANRASDGTAYQTIQEINNSNKPPELDPNSAMFNYGYNEVKDAINGTGDWLASCSDQTITTDRDIITTTTSNHLCMQPNDTNQYYCEVERAAPVVFDAVINVAAQGQTILTARYDLNAGTVSTISPTDGVGIESEFLGKTFAGMCENGDVNISLVSLGSWGGTSLDGKVDNSVSTQELQKPSCANGLVGIVQVIDKTDEPGDTSWLLTAQVRYRIEGQVGQDVQTPAGCYDSVIDELKEVNGLSSLDFGDTTDEPEYPYSFCRFDNYSTIEAGTRGYPDEIIEQIGPWYEGDTGNVTWRVNLNGFRCDPTGGQEYFVVTKRATEEELAAGLTDEGEYYTWEDIQAQQGQCAIYEADSSCSLVEKSCAEGWFWEREGEDDVCFAYTNEYQCTTESVRTVTSTRTENVCSGTLPCIGGDCETANLEANDQFIDAVAMASVVQHMEDGMNCEDPTDPDTCTIFEGEGKWCSWEPTGLGNDCCEAPDGIDIYEYAQAAYGLLQADAFIAGVNATPNSIVGGYQSLRQPLADAATSAGQALSDAYGAVTSVFTDAATTAAGSATGAVGDAGMSIFSDAAMDQLASQALGYVYENLPAELAEALITEGTGEAVGTYALSEGASQVVSMIGYAYGAYMIYQYIKLAINLLSACHEYEMDMGVRIATKQCIPIGEKYCAKDGLGVCYIRRQDHCCYDSILARIIMEQASPMLGHDLGAYSEEVIDGSTLRSCPGLTPVELSNLDWNQIDLSEWIDIMLESGITSFDQDVEKLTGSGRTLNNAQRDDGISRTIDRSNEVNLSDRADEARGLIKGDDIDCSYSPRPLACYFNDNGG